MHKSAVVSLIKIGMPSVLAIRDAIEKPKAVLDKEKVIDHYAFVVYDVLGSDHAKAWLLEEKRHCPKGAKSNYDKLLSANILRHGGGPKS